MKLIFVIEEASNFHPQFLKNFLKQSRHNTVGAVLIQEINPKYNMDDYFRKHRDYFTFIENIKSGLRKASQEKNDKIFGSKNFETLYSVRASIDFFKLDCLPIKHSVNKTEVIEWIRMRKADVIISCGQAIFGDEILKSATICCINRHSSLLPSYGGLLPVFHAIRNGENFTGASIHTMEKKLDGGIVLAQEKVPIAKGDTVMSLYQKTFDVSLKALHDALDKIEKGNFTPVPNLPAESYFSFPTQNQWKEFRKKGVKFI